MLQLWFASLPVMRAQYLRHGLALLVLKYGLDSAILFAGSGNLMSPLVYLHPSMTYRFEGMQTGDASFLLMAVLSLPFIWIGASMSMRRARHAGFSPWLGLLFFVPLINWLMILGLCVAPERERQDTPHDGELPPLFGQAVKALLCGLIVGFPPLLISVFGFEQYGLGLFVATPFVMGVVSAFIVAKSGKSSLMGSIGIAWLALLLFAGSMLLLALEGVICLAVTMPLAAALAAVGALVGRNLAGKQGVGSVAALIIAVPLTTGLPVHPKELPLRAAITSVTIDASPTEVWPHVVSFPDLPAPSDWLMKTGIACPLRARIEGKGVGAVRHCEFTTGAFVEPVTVWNPPHHLAFDVTSQPPPLEEWSPYQHVNAPHLLEGMQSERGEFKLEALPGGKTLLTGTTWYRIDMAPQAYWGWFSDRIVQRIHGRVLGHVKSLAERTVASQSR
ncbi:MAG: SRPBCC family protein [Myxococcota bacterium]|nr:SRPBCC family protein [Myxococcota bacterium]